MKNQKPPRAVARNEIERLRSTRGRALLITALLAGATFLARSIERTPTTTSTSC